MSDQTDQSVQCKAGDQSQYHPTLLIFLLMPIMAGIVAFLIGQNVAAPASEPTPAVVQFTPFTLVGSPAPDFSLPTPDDSGKTIALRDLRGKWVFLNFWATWCGPCREEMPLLQDVADGKFDEIRTIKEGVTVLGVDRDETPDVIRPFLQEFNITFPVVVDAGARINNQYGVIQLPITFIIDPEGVIRGKHIGVLDSSLVKRYLEKIARGWKD